MTDFPHRVERSVVIGARPETVFRYFTDSDRWARWWGQGSTIEAREGGTVYIRHANGVETVGTVLDVRQGERIAFTYGFTSGKPIPLGGSRVTIRLEPDPSGTKLHLLHEFQEESSAAEHVQGWRFQLSVFSNAVAQEVHAGCEKTVDEWFEIWTVQDAGIRAAELARVAGSAISYRDRFSLLDGIADVSAHIAAYQRFMPGLDYKRKGTCQHCQGTVLVSWTAAGADHNERMSGASVFVLDPDGRVISVTSFVNSQ
jgi:uncharacterized protein YndB with AHSA1/START domain